MARSNNPDNYPEYYEPTLMLVANTGQTIRIPTNNAHRLKQRVYAFINAYDKQEIALQLPYDVRKARRMRMVSLTSEPGFMVLTSKNHGAEADAFRAALEGIDPAAYEMPKVEFDPDRDAAIEAAMAAGEAEVETDHDEGLGDIRSLFNGAPKV